MDGQSRGMSGARFVDRRGGGGSVGGGVVGMVGLGPVGAGAAAGRAAGGAAGGRAGADDVAGLGEHAGGRSARVGAVCDGLFPAQPPR